MNGQLFDEEAGQMQMFEMEEEQMPNRAGRSWLVLVGDMALIMLLY